MSCRRSCEKGDGSAEEFQGDAVALEVNVNDTDTDMLMYFEDIGGTGHTAMTAVSTDRAHTGNVNQTILLPDFDNLKTP